MKRFAITGVAGYIAPRHLKAISDTGNTLVAALDPHDSVGILDRFFPEVAFFTEFERFDRHLEKLRRQGEGIHYLSICSPNHLHDAHIRLALRLGADAICEKPLVLNPWNLDALAELEKETQHRVYTVLQLRVHPALIQLREKLLKEKRKHQVILTYITPRGQWYSYSWKGDEKRSGGVITNIGIHFFDLLIWLFGKVEDAWVYERNEKKAWGILELERAEAQWFLSIDKEDLPRELQKPKPSTYRLISVDGQEVEFSQGFTDLHTRVYEEVLAGRGLGIEHARPSIELAYQLRQMKVKRPTGVTHPLIERKG